MLLHSDADPNTQDVFGITPLIHAAARGRLDTVQMLLQAGARPLVADSEGKTAIDYAESAQFPDVVADLRDAAKLMPQPVSPMPSMQSPFADVPNTPRLTPRVPGMREVQQTMLTPRVPSSYSGGDLTARRLAAEAAAQQHGASPKTPSSPAITTQQLSPLSTKEIGRLAKKLVHLSVMLEQDTVLSDTAYPTFHR